MQIFLDTIDIEQIIYFNQLQMIEGVTTNPSLFSASKKYFLDYAKEIAESIPGKPLSLEIIATDFEGMKKEALKISALASNIVVKIPMTWDGLKLCSFLKNEQIPSNVTLCFSASQAILAAKAGATYISPFVGRLDDISISGIKLIEDIKKIFNNYNISTKILSASVRDVKTIANLAIIGTDIVTITPKLLKEMLNHPLTAIGLEKFLNDWEQSGLKI